MNSIYFVRSFGNHEVCNSIDEGKYTILCMGLQERQAFKPLNDILILMSSKKRINLEEGQEQDDVLNAPYWEYFIALCKYK